MKIYYKEIFRGVIYGVSTVYNVSRIGWNIAFDSGKIIKDVVDIGGNIVGGVLYISSFWW